jgi:AraC-like DNA-binding protein
LALFTSDFLSRCGLSVTSLADPSRIVLRTGDQLHLDDGSFKQVREALAILANYTSTETAKSFSDEAVAAAFSLLIFTIAGLPEMAAAVAARTPRDELVASFLDLLEAHFRQRHQASAYALALHVSLRTLDRRVVAAQGQTARQTVSARLVLEAKRLLTQRDAPIKNIAYELGFSEPQNFTRFFRSQCGMSPEGFRTSLKS